MDSQASVQMQQQQQSTSSAAVHHVGSSLSTQAARLPGSYSSADMRSLDTRDSQQGDGNTLPRPTSANFSSPISTSGNWVDSLGQSHISGTEPRIFPGVVHERTRRGSLRKGSGSEKDPDGFVGIAPALSKLTIKENYVLRAEGTVLEDPEEDWEGRSNDI